MFAVLNSSIALSFVLISLSILPSQVIASDFYMQCAREAGSKWEPNNDSGREFSEIDPSVAIEVCENALSEDRSPTNIFRLARALFKDGRENEALSFLQESADSNYGPAYGMLGYANIVGSGSTEIDYIKAKTNLLLALENDFVPAANNLGYLYSEGLGVTKDLQQAETYYLMASEHGYTHSHYSLGLLYLNQESTAESMDLANEYFLQAAEHDHAASLNQLGLTYEWGRGFKQDLSKAQNYYQRSTEQGDGNGKANLFRLQKIQAYRSDIALNDWEPASKSFLENVGEHKVIEAVVDKWGMPAIESLYLPFYNQDVRLVRARFSDLLDTTIAFYFLADENQLLYLDGKSDAIHNFNQMHRPYLHINTLAQHYLWFFGYFVRSEPNKPFLVVEDTEDRILTKDLSPEILNEISPKLKASRCVAKDDTSYTCVAVILHQKALFNVQFVVSNNGAVQMTDDEAILTSKPTEVYSPITQEETQQYFEFLLAKPSLSQADTNALLEYKKQQKTNLAHRRSSLVAEQTALVAESTQLKEKEKSLLEEKDQLLVTRRVLEAKLEIATNGRNKKAFDMLTSASDSGNIDADHELSLFYLFGEYVKEDHARALAMLETNSDADLAAAQTVLAKIHSMGFYGYDKDQGQAHELFVRAAEQDDSEAQYHLGRQFDLGEGVSENKEQALVWYLKAADKGNEDAQVGAAKLLDWGDGVSQDRATAFQLYLEAAESGHTEAMFWAGHRLDFGRGVEQDHVEAVRWYRKAAANDYGNAQFWLGRKLARGEGINKNEVTAFEWYSKAAESGHIRAHYQIAKAYAVGVGVTKNAELAFKWYLSAANLGDSDAMYWAGQKLQFGSGVKKDEAEAVRWYRQAASEGNVKALYSLGQSYNFGSGVQPDEAKAFDYYLSAANEGHVKAQAMLGVAYVNGKGVNKNRSEGIRWLKSAASQGHETAISNLKKLGVR